MKTKIAICVIALLLLPDSARSQTSRFEQAVLDSRHFREVGNMERASRAANTAIKLRKNRQEGYYLLGIMSRSPKEALKHFNKAIALNPEIDYLLHHRSEIYYRLGRYENCIRDSRRCYMLNPKEDRIILNLRKAYQRSGKPLSEVSKWRRSATNGLIAGLRCEENNQFDKAVAHYSSFIKKHPRAPTGYRYRAELLKFRKKYREALADLKSASRLDRAGSKTRYHMASCYEALGETEEALRQYKLVFYIVPGDEPSAFRYAQLLKKSGKVKNAVSVYSECIKRRRNNGTAYRLRAECYEQLKDYSRAVADYSMAIKHSLSPAPSTLRCRARVYRKLGKEALARKDLAAAKRMDRAPF